MHTLQILSLLFGLSSALVGPPSSSCGACGLVGGECVRAYAAPGCSVEQTVEFSPAKCDSTCFTGTFASIQVCGNTFEKTNCQFYSDDSCQDYLSETEDQNDSPCYNIPGVNSYKCWWDC